MMGAFGFRRSRAKRVGPIKFPRANVIISWSANTQATEIWLRASALMQGLADGYFILPYTIGHYFATMKQPKPSVAHAEFKKAETDVEQLTKKLLSINGKRTVTSFHRELGKFMWDKCGMARNEA